MIKKKLFFVVVILFLASLSLAFQQSLYTRRIFPVLINPTSCNENQVFYNMISNRLLICTDTDTIDTVAYIGEGGGGSTTATYITQTPDVILSNEQALSTLDTGIVKNTTATGVEHNGEHLLI